MWVHLFRHGIAIDPTDPACPTDPERYLTEKGKARVRSAACGLRRVGIVPDLVLASPYVRAQETAAIAHEELCAPTVMLETTATLVPMADPVEVVELMRTRGEVSILCVGHSPNLDRVVAHLLGADDPISALKKAGCASLEVRVGRPGAGRGVLVGLYPSSALRQLGGATE